MTFELLSPRDVAADAEFALLCAKNRIDWTSAIVHAIALDYTHAGGHRIAALAELAAYLGDAGVGDPRDEIARFHEIAEGDAAPQNAKVPDRGAEGSACT